MFPAVWWFMWVCRTTEFGLLPFIRYHIYTNILVVPIRGRCAYVEFSTSSTEETPQERYIYWMNKKCFICFLPGNQLDDGNVTIHQLNAWCISLDVLLELFPFAFLEKEEASDGSSWTLLFRFDNVSCVDVPPSFEIDRRKGVRWPLYRPPVSKMRRSDTQQCIICCMSSESFLSSQNFCSHCFSVFSPF